MLPLRRHFSIGRAIFAASVMSVWILNGRDAAAIDAASLQQQWSRSVVNIAIYPVGSSAGVDDIAAGYCSGLVWRSGVVIAPYSALGDPNRMRYTVTCQAEHANAEVIALQAKVIAAEPYTNLAALRITDERLRQVVQPGRPEQPAELNYGDGVWRIDAGGWLGRGGELAIERGQITSLGRSLPPEGASRGSQRIDQSTIYAHASLLQTNLSGYLDGSGAVFVDEDGRAAAMQIDLRLSGSVVPPVALALPIDNRFIRVADSLSEGRLPSFSFLGIETAEELHRMRVDEFRGRGVLVQRVIPGSGAAAAGLQRGDVLVNIDGEPLDAPGAIYAVLAAYEPGATPRVEYYRWRSSRAERLDRPIALGKKMMLARRPAMAEVEPPRWQGALIDAVSTLPADLLSPHLDQPGFDAGWPAVLDVRLDSPAWDAGLRTGMAILEVDGRRVDDVVDFQQRVARARGQVALQAIPPVGAPILARVAIAAP